MEPPFLVWSWPGHSSAGRWSSHLTNDPLDEWVWIADSIHQMDDLRRPPDLPPRKLHRQGLGAAASVRSKADHTRKSSILTLCAGRPLLQIGVACDPQTPTLGRPGPSP